MVFVTCVVIQLETPEEHGAGEGRMGTEYVFRLLVPGVAEVVVVTVGGCLL